MPKVAVVSDSTASLPFALSERLGIWVVPMQVVIGGKAYDDGVDAEADPDHVAAALRAHVPVSTSRPNPAAVLDVYRRVAAEGADEIISVHISAEVSGTYDSAQLAARSAPVPVHVVDSRQMGAGTGYAAITAVEVAARGGSAVEAAAAARRRAEATASLFYVDSLDFLRRGGRVGAAAALLGTALAVKPLLHISDGAVTPLEKVRTTARASARLEELAVTSAAEHPVDVTVSHLASADAAHRLAAALSRRLDLNLEGREVAVGQVPAVLAAHVGPGLVGVTVAPR